MEQELKKPVREKPPGTRGLLMAELSYNKDTRGMELTRNAVAHCEEFVVKNKIFLQEFAEFNFVGTPIIESADDLNESALPYEVMEQLEELVESHELYDLHKLRKKLNIPGHETTREAPMEMKYVYEYYKKYKTLKYKRRHKVSDSALMRKLSSHGRERFKAMFGISQ